MIRAGGITGGVNHATRQGVRAEVVSRGERKPLQRDYSITETMRTDLGE